MRAEAPTAVVGNLRFTPGGVYADYLLSGLPFLFLSRPWQDNVAAEHAELWRTLPSGASVTGLTAPVPTRAVTRRMLHTHPDLGANPGAALPATAAPWLRHARMWEPTIASHRPRRRLFWLSLPLDFGLSGHTPAGSWRRWLSAMAGADRDSAPSRAAYH
jgi:hypothetical protein